MTVESYESEYNIFIMKRRQGSITMMIKEKSTICLFLKLFIFS